MTAPSPSKRAEPDNLWRLLLAALSFRGRSGRISFWLSLGVAALLVLLARALDPAGMPWQAVGGASGLLAPWLVVTAAARRLHDVGRGAPWLLVGLVPVVGQVVLAFWVALLPGEPGRNRYGAPPPRWWRD